MRILNAIKSFFIAVYNFITGIIISIYRKFIAISNEVKTDMNKGTEMAVKLVISISAISGSIISAEALTGTNLSIFAKILITIYWIFLAIFCDKDFFRSIMK